MIVVGRSELADMRMCPLKHKFRWREGWHLPDRHPESNVKAERGTQWHAILAAHYRAKMSAESAGETYTLEMARVVMLQAARDIVEVYESDEERLALLIWMAEGYLERHGTDPNWEVEFVERSMTVPILDPDDPDAEPEFGMRFTADLIVRMRNLGRRAIVDHKTIESSGVWNGGDVDLDDQLGLYIRGFARIDPDDPPILGMLNQVRRDKLIRPMTLRERFFRLNSTRTRAELDEIERDALSDLRRMHSPENLRRPSSAPDPRTCSWKCEFKEAHIALRRSGGDWDQAVRILDARGMSQDPTDDPALMNR